MPHGSSRVQQGWVMENICFRFSLDNLRVNSHCSWEQYSKQPTKWGGQGVVRQQLLSLRETETSAARFLPLHSLPHHLWYQIAEKWKKHRSAILYCSHKNSYLDYKCHVAKFCLDLRGLLPLWILINPCCEICFKYQSFFFFTKAGDIRMSSEKSGPISNLTLVASGKKNTNQS